MSPTAPLTSKRCILYIYSTNIGTEYFKHALYSPFFFSSKCSFFIILISLVHVLFTFYIQNVLKLKKNNSGTKGLSTIVCYSSLCSQSRRTRLMYKYARKLPAFCSVLVMEECIVFLLDHYSLIIHYLK